MMPPSFTVRVYVSRTDLPFNTSEARAQYCACAPDCCSKLPLGFDLDQSIAQRCAITLATAMTPEPPLSWLGLAQGCYRSSPLALARLHSFTS
jgi:hypothetical protein